MNIALAHYRVGETDGVSLEMEKWRTVLERMGHKVIYISGTPDHGEVYIPEMSFYREEFKRQEINGYCSLEDFETEEGFEKEIEIEAKIIEAELCTALCDYDIDLVIPNNIFSLGVGFSVALAFYRAITKLNLKAIVHNHDFYWERPHLSKPTCKLVKVYQDMLFPPRGSFFNHVVINKIGQQSLKNMKGLDSTVIPNIYDFEQPLWKKDEYNFDLRSKLGLSDEDIVLLQATRVAERKAIELAIQVVGEVKRNREKLYGSLYDNRNFGKESRIVLLMPGMIEAKKDYLDFLNSIAREEDVEILWCNSLMRTSRRTENAEKKYSLWDMYVIADLITYPSIIEGWGNQFIEGVFAEKNTIVFEYPVYKTDIKPLGFKVISLGDKFEKRENGYVKTEEEKIKEVSKKSIELLKNGKLYREMAETNFEIGKKYLSLEALEKLIQKLLKQL